MPPLTKMVDNDFSVTSNPGSLPIRVVKELSSGRKNF